MLLDSKESKTTATKLKVMSLNNPCLTYSEPEHWFMYTSGILMPVLEIPLQTTCSLALSWGQPERRCTVYHSIGADTKEDDCEVCAVYSKVWENWDWETKLRLMKYYVRAHPDIPKTPIHNKHTHKKRKCAKCGASCTACIMMLTAENRIRLNFLEF